MVTAYRIGAAEAWILRRAIKVNSVILANLVVGENVVPEFLQEDCTPENLAAALRDLLGDSALRRKQVEAFAKIDGIMSTGNRRPACARPTSCWRRCGRRGRQAKRSDHTNTLIVNLGQADVLRAASSFIVKASTRLPITSRPLALTSCTFIVGVPNGSEMTPCAAESSAVASRCTTFGAGSAPKPAMNSDVVVTNIS